MSQTLGTVRVVTSSSPIENVTTGSVKVSVNPGNAQRVQSINYNATLVNYTLENASDVTIGNTQDNNSVLTFDNVSNSFIVQNVPRLNGGTF